MSMSKKKKVGEMEHGIMGAEKQKVEANGKDGVNSIAELAAQFVKLRNRGLKMSGMMLSSVLRFMRYGRNAVSQDRGSGRQNDKQQIGEERISVKSTEGSRSKRASEILGNRPEIHIDQLPVFLEGNKLRGPIACVGKLRILESVTSSRVLTIPDSHDAKKSGDYRRLPEGESKENRVFIGEMTGGNHANTLLLTQHQGLRIAAPLYAKKTRTRIERIRAIGRLRNEVESRVAYDLRASGSLRKSHSSEVPNIFLNTIVRSPGVLKNSSMLPSERGTIYKNNFMRSTRPMSIKPNFSMDGSVLSNTGEAEKTQFELPAQRATGKGRREISRNGNQRNQAVKVEINQPLIGSVTIQTSRGDGGVYELRSKIEGVLMDILESVNTIG
jgi:hypothetical protein